MTSRTVAQKMGIREGSRAYFVDAPRTELDAMALPLLDVVPDTDLSLHHVIRIGYNHGLVESTCLSVNDTWSALKFTWPKSGKAYNNSHAVLNRNPE